jgi:hypothetical protein
MTSKDKKTAVAGGDGRNFEIPWRTAAWAVAGIFLLAIAVGDQVRTEVSWTLIDFLFAGGLLFGSLGAYEVTVRTTRDPLYRAGAGVAIAGALFLTWINLAVGLTDSVADLAYVGVPAVGLIGACIAGFRPEGMARAMLATAVAQALVGAIALIAGVVPAYNSAFEILGLTGLFVALFVGSAWLFRESARRS